MVLIEDPVGGRFEIASKEETDYIHATGKRLAAKLKLDRDYIPLIARHNPMLPMKAEVRLREALRDEGGSKYLNFNAAIAETVHQILVDLGQV